MRVTEKEIVRARKTKEQITKLHEEGYKLKELTISMVTANVMGIIYGLVFSIPFLIAYYLNFGYLFGGPDETLLEQCIILILLVASFPVHEAIHGLCMYFFNGRNKSLIEFGFMGGNPYCTCQSPINKTKYIIFAVMPTLVLGSIFAIPALTIGKLWWLILLVCTITGAGGDFTIIYKLLKQKGNNIQIVDHPYKCGFFALCKEFDTDDYDTVTSEIDALEVKNKD